MQEYYIRHIDGCTLNSQAERRRVIKCLRAAIKRRVSEVYVIIPNLDGLVSASVMVFP
mgnify:CR=1 FL=1